MTVPFFHSWIQSYRYWSRGIPGYLWGKILQTTNKFRYIINTKHLNIKENTGNSRKMVKEKQENTFFIWKNTNFQIFHKFQNFRGCISRFKGIKITGLAHHKSRCLKWSRRPYHLVISGGWAITKRNNIFFSSLGK